MKKISRCIFWGFVIGIVIGVLMAFFASSVQASTPAMENVSIESGKVYYDSISYEGAIILENMENENVTVSISVEVDQIEIVNTEVNLTITYFKGFLIKTHKSIYFEVPCEEGTHEIKTFVSIGRYTRITSYWYEAYGCVDEEEEEEEVHVEEWLGCS